MIRRTILRKPIRRAIAPTFLYVLCAAAQSSAPAQFSVRPDQTAPAAVTFGEVTPQYNFSYGADPDQPLLPTDGIWNFYMPVQVTASTPGWTTDEFGLGGIPDAFYDKPYFTSGGASQYAGGCLWNQPYNSPPTWVFNGGSYTNNDYEALSGSILRADAAIGSVYQSAAQQVPGSGTATYGFATMAEWNQDVYTSAPYLIGAIYFASDSCYSGDIEYGFAHYNYYNPPVDQFYFYDYSNCSAPSGTADSYGCIITQDGQHEGVSQCSAAVNIPTLPLNSEGTNLYFWYAYVGTSEGRYVFRAGVLDPYTTESLWACTGDPSGSPTFPSSTCPQTESASYACPAGQTVGTPFPIARLYGGLGSVTAGITNVSNTPPTGRTNPMLTLDQLYIAVP